MAYTNYILWGDDVPGAMGVHEAGAHQSCSLDDEFPALRKTVRGYLTPRLLLALGADYYADVFQPLDADLTALAALSGTNTIYYRSGTSTWSAVTIGSNLTFSGGTLSATGSGGGLTRGQTVALASLMAMN